MASSSIVSVSIHSDFSEFPTEKRYDLNTKVLELKKKLELITGANYTSMMVTLFVGDKEVGLLDNNDETLGHYLGQQGSDQQSSAIRLVVSDKEPSILQQDGDVPKFVLSEDKYLQRPNNVRNFIKEIKEKQLSN